MKEKRLAQSSLFEKGTYLVQCSLP